MSTSASTKRRTDTSGSLSAPSISPPHVQARIEARNIRLLELGFASYGDYLKSPLWSAVRKRFRDAQMPMECFCGDDDVQLHHLSYENLGHEMLSDLIALCRACHAMVHDLERRGLIELDLEGLVLDEERAVVGRAQIARLVAERERERREQREAEQAQVLALSFAARLTRVVGVGRRKSTPDLQRRVWVIGKMTKNGVPDRVLTGRLRMLEETVYGWDGWRDQMG